MIRYQIVQKPIATTTGEPAKWSMRAHGATYDAIEARDIVLNRLPSLGYIGKLLKVS